MTIADGTLAVFTFFNGLRFLAYVPQIVKALRDQSGAEAISFGTWGLFLASHASAMAYAIENQGDWTMAFLFLSNAVGCSAVLLIAGWKRTRGRRKIERRPERSTARAANTIQRWVQRWRLNLWKMQCAANLTAWRILYTCRGIGF
jgi:hypothetical protein